MNVPRKWNTPSPSFYFSDISEHFIKQFDLKIQYSINLFLKEVFLKFMTEKINYLVTLIPFSGLFHMNKKILCCHFFALLHWFPQRTNCLCVFKPCWKSLFFFNIWCGLGFLFLFFAEIGDGDPPPPIWLSFQVVWFFINMFQSVWLTVCNRLWKAEFFAYIYFKIFTNPYG
jgi:hypothetical protein